MKTFSKRMILSLSVAIMLVTNSAAQHSHNHEVSNAGKNAFLLMMDTMMNKMTDIPKSIYANEVFISMMIPHHEGAIEMAAYEIRFGTNSIMRQLAKSIFNEQQVEVQQMRLWLHNFKNDTVLASPCFLKNINASMIVMMQNMPNGNVSQNVDYAFARIMIPHHQAAIDMARAIIQNGADNYTLLFARRIIAAQQIEIEQMLQFLSH